MKKFEVVNNGSGKATIKIIGEISWWRNSSADFIAMVDDLLNQGVNNIHVYINSPGGSMIEANEIGNQLLRFTGSRTGKLGALCASAGTILSTYLQRVVGSSNTQYMIHDPSTVVFVQHEEDFDSNKKLYKNLRNDAINRYHKKTGMPKTDISEAMKATTWYTAEEAKELGFIDEIDEEVDNVLPPDTQDVFDRYGFQLTQNILNQLPKPAEPKNENETENNMKKIALKLGLPENATEDQIIAAMEAQSKTAQNNAVKLLVEMGVAKGLKKETVEKLAKADFDATLEMVNESKAPEDTTKVDNNGGDNDGKEKGKGEQNPDQRETTLVEFMKKIMNNGGQQTPAGTTMTFSQMMEKDKKGLVKMINETPDKVQELFKAEFGTYPKIEDLKELAN